MRRSKRILIYKLCCMVFAAVLLFLPQRGLPYSELRVLATVLGIDGGENGVSVSAQLAIPLAQGSDGQASTVAQATGGSLAEALENLEIGLGRRINYGHLSTVAIGTDTPLADMKMFVGCLMSSGKIGPGAYLVYCPESSASDFISQAQQMGESSDAELSGFISYSKSGNHVSTTTAIKFLQGLNSVSHAAFLPCVQLEDDNGEESKKSKGTGSASDENGKASNEQSGTGKKESGGQSGGQNEDQKGGNGGESGGQNSGGGTQKKKLVAADAVAVMGGDAQTAVVLDTLTTRGIVWQDPTSDFGLVELRNVQIDGQEYPSLPARMTGKSVKKLVRVENGEIVFTYKIKVKLRLDDAQKFGNPLSYDKVKDTLEKEYESMIESNLLRTVAASKEANIDFLRLRDTFHKYCKKGFESFELSSVVVKVDAKVKILT